MTNHQSVAPTAPRRRTRGPAGQDLQFTAASALPWRQRAFVNLKLGGEVLGVSSTSIYRLAGQGKLILKRVAGRVVLDTTSVVALVDAAEDWSPSDRGSAGRKRRNELAQARWQG